MMLLLNDNQVERVLNAVHNAVRDCEEHADEARRAADAGHSDGLIADYGAVAQAFQESADSYKALASEIERQRESARHDGGD